MAADHGPVKYDPMPTAEHLDAKSPGTHESELEQPGITVNELIARVGDLKTPDDGFADNLEAIQAEQPPMTATPEWPD